MWIARDRDGCLFAYKEKPTRRELLGIFYSENLAPLPSDLYPEVTWENSPKELVVKL